MRLGRVADCQRGRNRQECTAMALACCLASVLLLVPCLQQAPAEPAAAPPPAPVATQPAPQPPSPPAPPQPVTLDPWTGAAPKFPVGSRVYIFIDHKHEAAGTVVTDDPHDITVTTTDGQRTFAKGQVLAVIPLLDNPGGAPGIVQLRDGSTIRANIREDSFEGVTHEAAGIVTKLPRSRVYRTVLEVPFDQRYQKLKASISESDAIGWFGLCKWLFDSKRYEMARDELRAYLAKHDAPAAADLLRQAEAQLVLTPRSNAPDGTAPPSDGSTGGGGNESAPTAKETLPDRILTDEEVNIVRVYELDLRRPPPMFIDRATIQQLIERYPDSDMIPADAQGRLALFNADAKSIARLMFDLRARDLYPQIKVGGEPAALALFWHRVHDAWVMPNCATSRCHGGTHAGGFFLHHTNFKTDNVRYTNLLILLGSHFEKGPMIDFDDPRESLLIQYGLPRVDARHPHPDVRGWRPIFVPTARKLRADTEEWIRTMYQPRPDYPVDYQLPVLAAPDAPASLEANPVR